MAADGTPEWCAKRCGEAIAQLRTARRWSRAQLVIRLCSELAANDPCFESISETWLARLENGRMVKVPRATVEALCRALRCTPLERARILLHADRNVLASAERAPSPAAEVLTFAMDQLYHEASDMLDMLVGQRTTAALGELELLELTESALQQVIARHRRRQVARGQMHSAQAAT